MRNPAIAFTFC